MIVAVNVNGERVGLGVIVGVNVGPGVKVNWTVAVALGVSVLVGEAVTVARSGAAVAVGLDVGVAGGTVGMYAIATSVGGGNGFSGLAGIAPITI